MAIKFGETFGAGSNNNGSGDRKDQPKAKVWLNIGYVVAGVPTADGGTEDRFVSLPVGIPLDTMEMLPTNSKNQPFAQFQAARNDLHSQIMELAETLAPGEDRVLGEAGGLCIQVRRVDEPRAPVSVDENNPFAAKVIAIG